MPIRAILLDKDGTLIDFGPMWSDWAETLARSLDEAIGRPIETQLFVMLGYDPVARTVLPGGGLAATPMARLRERTAAVLADAGVDRATAERALRIAWHAPDPIALARPLTDLRALFERLRAGGLRLAVATSDDREPSVRTIEALGLTEAVEAMVCADDGIPVKPAPDMVVHLCEIVGVLPGRTAVVGDAPADLRMARAAGAGLVVGVLTGVGERADLEPLADVVLDSVEALARD